MTITTRETRKRRYRRVGCGRNRYSAASAEAANWIRRGTIVFCSQCNAYHIIK